MTPEEALARTEAMPEMTLERMGEQYSFECSFRFSDDPKLALGQLDSAQEELRTIKAELALSMQAPYQQKAHEMISTKYGRQAALQVSLTEQAIQSTVSRLAPYAAVQQLIDQIIATLDRSKLDILSGGLGGTLDTES